jgi:hypothetical protein
VYSDDGQKNCPKHKEFHFQNKFEKLLHLIVFIIRILVCVLHSLSQTVSSLSRTAGSSIARYILISISLDLGREENILTEWQYKLGSMKHL